MNAKRASRWWRLAGALAVAGCFATQSPAETETVDGVAWTYSIVDGRAMIGSGTWNVSAVSPASGAISIPSVLGGCSVTAIGDWAFQNCTDVTEVSIPDSVTNIGRMAFYGCTSLLSVAIPEGVERIDNSLFEFCGALREVSMPDGVTYVGRESFAGCSNLTALALPSSVTWIAGGAFHHCNGLAALYVPGEWENPEELFFQAELPSGCPFVRYDATGGTRTAETPVPVPHAWLALKASSSLAANGSDFEAAAKARAANGRKMWECWVAGLDPVAGGRDFTAEISFVDGKAKVESVDPDLGDARAYTLQGKKDLLDEGWNDMATVPDSEEEDYRFFCVGVSLPE